MMMLIMLITMVLLLLCVVLRRFVQKLVCRQVCWTCVWVRVRSVRCSPTTMTSTRWRSLALHRLVVCCAVVLLAVVRFPCFFSYSFSQFLNCFLSFLFIYILSCRQENLTWIRWQIASSGVRNGRLGRSVRRCGRRHLVQSRPSTCTSMQQPSSSSSYHVCVGVFGWFASVGARVGVWTLPQQVEASHWHVSYRSSARQRHWHGRPRRRITVDQHLSSSSSPPPPSSSPSSCL